MTYFRSCLVSSADLAKSNAAVFPNYTTGFTPSTNSWWSFKDTFTGNFLLSAKTPNLDSTKMPACSFSAQTPTFLETFDKGDCVLQELGSPFKEIMPFAATWMDLEFTTLSEVRQKDKYQVISPICGIYIYICN